MPTIRIPKRSLIVLIGMPGIGKAHFARRVFPGSLIVTYKSEEEFHDAIVQVKKALKKRQRVVIAAQNLSPKVRMYWAALGRKYEAFCFGLVLDLPHHAWRPRYEKDGVIDEPAWKLFKRRHRKMYSDLSEIIKTEKFHQVQWLTDKKQIDDAVFEIAKLACDKREDSGPFDIIGDVHGCFNELYQLLMELGYYSGEENALYHPAGRKLIFLGDLVDRGPHNLKVLDLVRRSVQKGTAYLTLGNHDWTLLRYLRDHEESDLEGQDKTVAEIKALPPAERKLWKRDTIKFLGKTGSHFVFDGGKLVVAHAGLPEIMHGSATAQARAHALFGSPDSVFPDKWIVNYQGHALVVYGHTPTSVLRIKNNTLNIDTACVFGGYLTAYRYPEGLFVSVPAKENHAPEDVITTQAPEVLPPEIELRDLRQVNSDSESMMQPL